MSADDDRPWTAPNIESDALGTGSAPEWAPVGPAPEAPAPPPAAHLPLLPGVDLPTQLPDPQPAPVGGLDAHKPGATPLRPLGVFDIISGSVSVLRGNAGVVALIGACLWVPTIVLVVIAFYGENTVGRVVLYCAAFVVPVLLAGALAVPLHAAAVGSPMPFRQALSAVFTRVGSRMFLGAVAVAVLAAPAILLGLLLVSTTELAASSPAALLLPVLYALLLSCYLLLASPILMAQTVLAVEGADLASAVRRAVGLWAKGFVHLLIPTVLQSLVLGTIGFAVLMSMSWWFLGDQKALVILIAAVFVSPLVAGFGVQAYLDARIRQEALDVELMLGAGR